MFIFGGQLIAERISHNQNILNWVIGGIFALTAGIQLWKILKKKDAHHQMEHPEALKKKIEEQLDEIQKHTDHVT